MSEADHSGEDSIEPAVIRVEEDDDSSAALQSSSPELMTSLVISSHSWSLQHTFTPLSDLSTSPRGLQVLESLRTFYAKTAEDDDCVPTEDGRTR
ncbi:hypothetical protein J6590_012288 [Homalodisca vitripennis]|nr:hypothetical protein J6590_012288 [Homalodisca vitripennis]